MVKGRRRTATKIYFWFQIILQHISLTHFSKVLNDIYTPLPMIQTTLPEGWKLVLFFAVHKAL